MAVTESKGDGYSIYNGAKVLSTDIPADAVRIPLDGMKVIEWDGDTTGLESLGRYLYFVSYNTDVATSEPVVTLQSSGDGRLVSLADMGGYWGVTNTVYYNPIGVVDYTPGIEFNARSGSYTALFAYYPTEEEPESMSRGKIMMLHQMFPEPIAKELTGKWFWYE